jgi:hypothetical protein
MEIASIDRAGICLIRQARMGLVKAAHQRRNSGSHAGKKCAAPAAVAYGEDLKHFDSMNV